MPEFYDVLPRVHVPMAQLAARMPSTDPRVNFTTPVERGYSTTQAVTESTRCLMCNYNIWFDPFRCVLCGACADVCPEGVIHMIDINQMKSEGALPELVDAYGWNQGAAMVLDEERCIRCALCVKRCPYDAITMDRFELQEVSSDGRLYKESYRDTQLGCRHREQAEAGGSSGELPRAGRRDDPPQCRLALHLPPAVPQRRTVAGDGVMNNVFLHMHPVRVRQHAVKFAYTFCLGGLSFFLFLVLAITGVYLMFFYVPSPRAGVHQHPADPSRGALRAADPEHPPLGRAPDGVLRLPAHDAGLLPRRLQAAARVQLGRRRGAAPPDRDAVVHGLPAAVGPDRLLGHHHRHQHGQLRALFNKPTQLLLLGGIEVGQNTLLRFYVLHVILLPLVGAIFLAIHFWRIRKDGGISGPL